MDLDINLCPIFPSSDLQKYKDSRSFLDQQLKQELDLLRQNIKLLKDAYEQEKKLNKNCIKCEKQNLNFEIKKGGKMPKKEFFSENKIFSNPRGVKEEYVEHVKIEPVKSELVEQVNVKNEPLE